MEDAEGDSPLLRDHHEVARTSLEFRGLEFRERDRPCFREEGGYPNEADPWKEQKYSRLF